MLNNRFAAVALAAVASMLSATALARDLAVVSWGGAYQDAQREVYFKPFMEKTKITMTEENWDGGVGTLRAKIQGGNNNWDVVQVERSWAARTSSCPMRSTTAASARSCTASSWPTTATRSKGTPRNRGPTSGT